MNSGITLAALCQCQRAAVRYLEFSKFGILVMWLVSEHDYASSYQILS